MQLHSAALLVLLAGMPALASPGPEPQPAQEQPSAPVPTEKERDSKVAFPVRLQPIPGELGEPGAERLTFRLAGMGLRTKTIFNVKVYAIGYYIEPAGALKALAKWKGVPHAELEKKGEFYGALLQDGFGRSMRMVMTRDVDTEDMRDAFEEELRPRLAHAATEWDMQGGEEALTRFRGYFDIDELRKDTVMVFTWMPGGKLHTSVAGVDKPVIENQALCWALFDIWFGEQKLAKKVKGGLVRWIPNILAEQGLPPQKAEAE